MKKPTVLWFWPAFCAVALWSHVHGVRLPITTPYFRLAQSSAEVTQNPNIFDFSVNPTEKPSKAGEVDTYEKLIQQSQSLEDLEGFSATGSGSGSGNGDNNESGDTIYDEGEARETTTIFPTLFTPVTTPFSFSSLLVNKTARNFGLKVRGIATNNANSVTSAKNSTSISGSNISKSNAPLLRARPTSSVISYNPTNYNRIVKRRKNPFMGRNHTINSIAVDDTTISNTNNTYEEQSTIIPSQDLNSDNKNSSSNYNLNSNVVISSRPLSSLGIRSKRPKPVVLSDTIAINPTTSTIEMSKDFESSATPSHSSSHKVRRVKITSRRPALGVPHSEVTSTAEIQPSETAVPTATTSTKDTIAPTAVFAESGPESIKSLTADSPANFEEASVTVSNGVYRYRFPDTQFSSRKVIAEDFVIHRQSFGDDDDDAATTTEFYPTLLEATTGLPMGTLIEGSVHDDDDAESAGPELTPKYRDYFPEDTDVNLKAIVQESSTGSVSSDNDQHRRSSEDENKLESGSSVTVTVTQTVIETPTTPATKISSQSTNSIHRPTSSLNQYSHSQATSISARNTSDSVNHEIVVDEKVSASLIATPALPTTTTTLLAPSETLKVNEDSYEDSVASHHSPPPPNTVNHPIEYSKSVEHTFLKTSSFGNSSGEQITNKYGLDGIGHGETVFHHYDDEEERHDHGFHANANTEKSHLDLIDEDLNSDASITPSHATAPLESSKDFKSIFYTKVEHPHFTSSSYEFTSSSTYSYYGPDSSTNEADESMPTPPHEEGMDYSKKEQQLRPTTTSFWDNLGYKSMVLVLSNKTTSTGAPGVSGGAKDTKISGSTPFLTDQESGYSTPEVETEHPPVGLSVADVTSTPSPGNDADNEISEEEQNKTANKEQGQTDNKNGNASIVDNSDKNEVKDKKESKIAIKPSAPIFVHMLLDMSRAQFCTNLPSFKEMIVTVYAQQKTRISSEQIVVLTEPNCTDIDPANNSTTSSKAAIYSSTNQNSDSSVINGKNVTRTNKTATQQLPNKTERKTRSTDQETGRAFNRTSNLSDSSGSIGKGNRDNKTSFLPVYFFVNNKNGSFDRELTESFLDLWTKNTTSGSMFFHLVKKVDMVSSSQLVSEHAPANENSGIIAAITIASIAAACLFLLGVLLLVMRHRQTQTKFAKRCTPVTLDDYSLDNISVYNSFRRKQRLRGSKRSYTNAAFDDPNAPTRPLTPTTITSALTDASGLESEFKGIPNINPTLDDIPSGAETKNRYANVIPMPDTRVLLTFQDDQPNSDYMNANFIRGVSGEAKKYIITQGPLDETVVDFWRMVWEQQVRVILMVTDFAESGIAKCAEYYPRSETIDCSQLHGDFQITLERRDITENCITSYLVIKDMERNLRRDIIHMWYHSWPEKGVPSTPNTTADFLIKARKFTKEPSPVLVHCSPGTGRSGTLVACDIVMKTFETLHAVDIPRTVMKIRQDRAGCVQTKEQYLHIYDVLNYYASKISGNQPDSI